MNFVQFNAPCDENGEDSHSYFLITDKDPCRQPCFGNALVSEQFVLSALERESDIPLVMPGYDNCYPDTYIFYFPLIHEPEVREHVEKIVNNWQNGDNSQIGFSEEGEIYLALRKTLTGFWLFAYDGTTYCALDGAETLFESAFELEDSFHPDKCFRLAIKEESSGKFFFNYLQRQYPEVFDFMKTEEIFDNECQLYQ